MKMKLKPWVGMQSGAHGPNETPLPGHASGTAWVKQGPYMLIGLVGESRDMIINYKNAKGQNTYQCPANWEWAV